MNMKAARQQIDSTSSHPDAEPATFSPKSVHKDSHQDMCLAMVHMVGIIGDQSLLLDDNQEHEGPTGQKGDVALPKLAFEALNPENTRGKWQEEGRIRAVLQAKIEQLAEQAKFYEQKYIHYKNMAGQQQKVVEKMVSQLTSAQQLARSTGKFNAQLELKDLEIDRLKEELLARDQLIYKLQEKVVRRSKLSNIVIEVDNNESEGQGQIRRLQGLVCQQQKMLLDNGEKMEKLIRQFWELSTKCIKQESQIATQSNTIYLLEHQNNKLNEQKCELMQKIERLGRVIGKGQEKIRRLGMAIVNITSPPKQLPERANSRQ